MFLTNLVYLFHIVFHCILLFVSVAHRDLTVYALINMALLLLLLLLDWLASLKNKDWRRSSDKMVDISKSH